MAAILAGCANRGIGPQGGPIDSIPPKILKQTPLDGTVNFAGNKVEIVTNEYLQLDRVSENVLISPPLRHQPDIKAVGKKVVVEFKDTLKPNTTYSIDFGNAICDYHERIPIRNYHLGFSTGDAIDSLEVYGQVLNAENLNPVLGVMVGLHSNLSDTAFATLQLEQIAKTDSMGNFAIRHIHEGDYRLYALADQSRDYIYQPGEAVAVFDTIVSPYIVYDSHQDTVWQVSYDTLRYTDTLALDIDSIIRIDTLRSVDTILTYSDQWMEPGNITLLLYREDKTRQYFQRAFREERHLVRLVFSARQDSVPVLEADWLDSALVIPSRGNDTIQIWLKDSAQIGRDSLQLVMSYYKSDSLLNLAPATDTLNLIYRAPRMADKVKKEMEKKAANRLLNIKCNAGAKFGANDTLRLHFDYPVDSVYMDSISLVEKIDTSFVPVPFTLVPADSGKMVYHVLFDHKPEHKYEFRLDSAAVRDIYGHVCKQNRFQMQVRSLTEYSTLMVKLIHPDPDMYIQLLDSKDQVVRQLPASEEGSKFAYLEPGTYYMRLFVDRNKDGRWTTGDVAKKRQPEPVIYFPKKLALRANWDFEETFDWQTVNPLESKPATLIKVETGNPKK